MTTSDTDSDGNTEQDRLRALLRASDPAAGLRNLDPEVLAQRLEVTVSDTHTIESRFDGTHDRSRLTWLVAAAAVVLIAGGAAFGLLNRDEENTPAPGDQSALGDSPDPTQTVTRLSLGGPASARCMAPNVAVISRQELAFDGVVTSISGGIVTLEPSTFYAGDPTDLVTVRSPSRDLQQLLAAVDFEEGERYLVAATGGRVAVCGISTDWTAPAERRYQRAFEQE